MWSWIQQWLVWLVVTRPLAALVWTVSLVLRWFHNKPPIPPISNPLLLYSATELARIIRSRKVSCTEVIEAYIARVKEVNPIINAVVQDRFDQALQEAQVVDKNLANTIRTEEELARDTPLLGVPITIKESIPVAGMSNNAGVPGRVRVAEADAVAVAALRARGAIPLLVSNTPELCVSFETYNPVMGRTNNPYDPRRTPGGSSGGEGALLASAASVIGLGSDIGGSGRLPASFCGVYGHKPTSGYINAEGHMPSGQCPIWHTIFVYAPMSRYAIDLPMIMAASIENEEKLKELRLNDPVDLKQVKFFYLEEDGSALTSYLHRDVRSALNKAVAHVEQTFKVSVQKLDIEEFKHTPELSFFLSLQLSPPHSIFQKTEDNLTDWKSVTWQWILWLLCLSPHAFHAIMFGTLMKAGRCLTKSQLAEMEECRDAIEQKLKNQLGDDGVMLYPTFPLPALYHTHIYYQQMNAGYLSFFNVINMPATACPILRTSKGLPIGIQVIANSGQDRLTLAVAQEMERAFGGWVPPTGADMMEIKSKAP